MTRYDQQSDYPRLVERLRELCAERLTAAAIAERLNAEGFRPPKRADRFTREMVLRLTWQLGLARREPHGSRAGLGRDEYRPAGLARRLGVNRDTVRRWVRAGVGDRASDADGHHVIWADAANCAAAGTAPTAADVGDKARLAELTKPPMVWGS